MSVGLAIFVKTPALSPVKSRLWPSIGRRCAEALYLASAEAVASVAERAGRTCGIVPYWAVAEDVALHSDAWLDLPHIPQGCGGLGQRMATVYRSLRQRHHAALLIGADAPQLTVRLLGEAAEWLATTRCSNVIGRADDGGFWIFGGNYPIESTMWTSVEYSRGDTAARFVAAIGTRSRWREVERLRDIDIADDIPAAVDALSSLHDPTPAQSRLLEWLRNLPAASKECAWP